VEKKEAGGIWIETKPKPKYMNNERYGRKDDEEKKDTKKK
jgi:hypothetical protein